MLKQNLLLLLLILLVSACSDLTKVDNVEFKSGDPEFAVPIVHGSLNLEDIFNEDEIENTQLIVYPDSSMSLFYSGDILMQTATDIFPPIYGFIPVVVAKERDTIQLPVQRLDLIRASLTGDSLIVGARANVQEDVFVHVEILSFTRYGEVISFDLELLYDGSLPTQDIQITTMEDMNFDFVDNSMVVTYDARNANGEKVDLEFLQLYWDEMTFSYVEGYFSKNEVNIPGDFIDIEIYDQWINGDLYFEDPIVEVLVDNSFGFPVRAKVNELKFVGLQGQEVDLESAQNDRIDFLFPRLHEVGRIKKNRILYDSSNSNIEEIVNIQPVRLEYDIDAIGNPDEDSTIIGFFTDSSFIRINVSVELPVRGWANNFTARDTFDFEIQNIEDIESAEFKMVFENSMPLELDLQVFLLDGSMNLIDSMFVGDPLNIEPAHVDQNGRSVSKEHSEKVIGFDELRMQNLESAAYGVIVGRFLTREAPNRSVALMSGDVVDFRMGAKLKFK